MWSLLYFIVLEILTYVPSDFHCQIISFFINFITRKFTPHFSRRTRFRWKKYLLTLPSLNPQLFPGHSFLSCEVLLFEQMVLVSLFLVRTCFFFRQVQLHRVYYYGRVFFLIPYIRVICWILKRFTFLGGLKIPQWCVYGFITFRFLFGLSCL